MLQKCGGLFRSATSASPTKVILQTLLYKNKKFYTFLNHDYVYFTKMYYLCSGFKNDTKLQQIFNINKLNLKNYENKNYLSNSIKRNYYKQIDFNRRLRR